MTSKTKHTKATIKSKAKSLPSNGWIKIQNKMPNKTGSYLTYDTKDGYTTIEHFHPKEWNWKNIGITHWMELPEPPKK